MSLITQLEAVLFVASKPLTIKKLAKVLGVSEAEVQTMAEGLAAKYDPASSGVVLLATVDELQLVSGPAEKNVTEQFVKSEISGELTRPQLETLTVVSYCGPITKPELEQIRGVNCSIILRNLLMRGLVQEGDASNALLPTYEVSMEYLRHLGLTSLSDLPEYAELHNHANVTQILQDESK